MPNAAAADHPASDWRSTACILCECNCGIQVQMGGADGRRFVRVRGDDAHPVSRGYACEKASRVDFYQNGVHRLTRPLRRRADGSFEEISWDTAILEVAAKLAALRDAHGGESILYYGGGGQGNHLPSVYSRATRAALGMRYQSSALAQEKTGEYFVASRMVGGIVRADFEHCEVGLLLGKNPWYSHGIARARVTLREIARDPARTLIVIDPRLTETAEIADIHLRVRPGADSFLLAAMIAVVVQEGLVAEDWIAAHADGLSDVLPRFTALPVGEYSAKAGVDEALLRQAARRIAGATSVASFEDLGVQMNRHSTLVSYLHKLLILLCGQFGRKGAMFRPTSVAPLFGASSTVKPTPVTGANIIGGLVPCNVIPDEILSDHAKRFRALFVESANPVHSLADSSRMRQALAALDLLVVVDVALTETARLAHYVLPVASQFEKCEATFFNFEFPRNAFHVRRALLEPQHGLFSEAELHSRLCQALGALPNEPVSQLRAAWPQGREKFALTFAALMQGDPRLAAVAPVLLYRSIGDLLPVGYAESAALWGLCQLLVQRQRESLRRAGFTDADALFSALLEARSAVVFSVDEWDESFKRVSTSNGKIHLAVPEMFEELDALRSEPAPQGSSEFPLVLSAGERRSFTANTIIRNPAWRNKDPEGALRIHPQDAARAGVENGGLALLTTRGGSAQVRVEVSDRMLPGHVSLPNGQGVDYPADAGANTLTGVPLNELTRGADRDWFAGTPWHKHTPARVQALTGVA